MSTKQDRFKNHIQEITHIKNVLLYQIRDSFFYDLPEGTSTEEFDYLLDIALNALSILQTKIGLHLAPSSQEQSPTGLNK